MRDLIGQQLGNYRLVKVLGRGGFAEVYLGQHVRLSTQVAIKVLHAHLSEEQIMGFEQEAKTIANLVHSHIVRILDFDVSNGIPFLVMDYCPDGTLRKRHAKGEHVPLSSIVSYVQQVADALQYAHENKIIHRDIKPENMLIGQRSTLLLSDFGIAATAHSTSSMSSQIPVGTIPYMAPEQIQAQARPASDQYALGIVVYEWLCGTRPFEGSYTEIFAKHLMTLPPPLLEKVPTLPPEVEQVVLTALTKDPKQRFASVQAFATALEQASQSGQSQPSISLREVTPPSQPEQNRPSVPPPVVNQPLLPTILATPAHLSPQPTMQVRYTYTGHSNTVYAVAWSPDGRRIASGSADQTVQVWDAADGNNVYILKSSLGGYSNTVYAVAWSPDGKRIASGSNDKTVQVWVAANGNHLYTYKRHFSIVRVATWSTKGHSDYVRAVAWSPDGKRIASGSDDKTVQVWDVADGGNVYTYKRHSYGVNTVAWSPDGKRIASSSIGGVLVWNAVDGSYVYMYKGHSSWVESVAWSPDGQRIASGSADKTVQVWNAVDGSNVFTYKGHSRQVSAVAWSLDGRRIASGSNDRTVQVWNAVDGSNVYTYKGHSSYVTSVAWSSDGRRIASGSRDETVQVWEAS